MKKRVENGVVQSRVTLTGPGGRPWQAGGAEFFRVLDGGVLQWGAKDSRSGGVKLSTEKLVDENTLKGTEELIGATPPPGVTIDTNRPQNSFTFKRRTADKKSSSNNFDEAVQFINASFSTASQSPRGFALHPLSTTEFVTEDIGQRVFFDSSSRSQMLYPQDTDILEKLRQLSVEIK